MAICDPIWSFNDDDGECDAELPAECHWCSYGKVHTTIRRLWCVDAHNERHPYRMIPDFACAGTPTIPDICGLQD